MVDRNISAAPNDVEVDIDFDKEYEGIDLKNTIESDYNLDFLDDDTGDVGDTDAAKVVNAGEAETSSIDMDVDFGDSEPEFDLDSDVDFGNVAQEPEGTVGEDVSFDEETVDFGDSLIDETEESFNFDDDPVTGDSGGSDFAFEEEVTDSVSFENFGEETEEFLFEDDALENEGSEQKPKKPVEGLKAEKQEVNPADSGQEVEKSGLLKKFANGAKGNSDLSKKEPEVVEFEEKELITPQVAKKGTTIVPMIISSLIAGLIGASGTYFLTTPSDSGEIDRIMDRIANYESKNKGDLAQLTSQVESMKTELGERIDLVSKTAISASSLDKFKSEVSSDYKEVTQSQNELVVQIKQLQVQAEKLESVASKDSSDSAEYRKLIKAIISLKSMVDSNQDVSDKKFDDLLELVRLQDVNSSHELAKVKETLQTEITDVLKVVKDNQERYKKLQSSHSKSQKAMPKRDSQNMVESALGLNNEINIVKGGKPTYVMPAIMPNIVFLNVPIDNGSSMKLVHFKVGDPLDGYGKITSIDSVNEIVMSENGRVSVVKPKSNSK
ncbi:hypothetical protein [Vibrio sp. D431a]|uniref:hypothetical protein n=1 Tax=Vibrio sp. D431a TaxID=2837388 RepID=UPI002557B292|nr:hypothetical protein [Vibrio sp. D431a]MDK9793822.1 hypothetical protein [Vibrio sp. D431a]